MDGAGGLPIQLEPVRGLELRLLLARQLDVRGNRLLAPLQLSMGARFFFADEHVLDMRDLRRLVALDLLFDHQEVGGPDGPHESVMRSLGER